MKLIVNGEEQSYDGAMTIAQLLEQRGQAGRVAVAVNGEFVARSQYSTHALKDGDDVEIVAPIQGG